MTLRLPEHRAPFRCATCKRTYLGFLGALACEGRHREAERVNKRFPLGRTIGGSVPGGSSR